MRKAIATFLVLLCATAACGQFADVSSAGGSVTINAAWRFHTGDDPQWASPNFDDSQWPLLRLDKSWADQGYKGYSGYAWYRFVCARADRPFVAGIAVVLIPAAITLFGFDRAAAISMDSADKIAHAAQAFGQDDDITVLTIMLAPAEVLHA